MSQITLMTPTIIQVTSYYPPQLSSMENCAEQIIDGAGVPLERQMKS